MNKGLLVLENGLVLEGLSIGVQGTSVGELVFNTSMSNFNFFSLLVTLSDSNCRVVIVLQCRQFCPVSSDIVLANL